MYNSGAVVVSLNLHLLVLATSWSIKLTLNINIRVFVFTVGIKRSGIQTFNQFLLKKTCKQKPWPVSDYQCRNLVESMWLRSQRSIHVQGDAGHLVNRVVDKKIIFEQMEGQGRKAKKPSRQQYMCTNVGIWYNFFKILNTVQNCPIPPIFINTQWRKTYFSTESQTYLLTTMCSGNLGTATQGDQMSFWENRPKWSPTQFCVKIYRWKL
jgi:hypothetical protein